MQGKGECELLKSCVDEQVQLSHNINALVTCLFLPDVQRHSAPAVLQVCSSLLLLLYGLSTSPRF